MPLRYVALGDSYTIGISVARGDAWPELLTRSLSPDRDGARRLNLLANLATNGRTSRDVLRDQLPRQRVLDPQFVSLLVGVNDVVQGIPAGTYATNVGEILDRLCEQLPANRLVVVTTPDYTRTPAGGRFGEPATQRAALQALNTILTNEATARRVAVVDIWDLSERAADDRALVARDGLHPSARQYELWVGRIRPVVEDLLIEV